MTELTTENKVDIPNLVFIESLMPLKMDHCKHDTKVFWLRSLIHQQQ